MDQYEAMIKLLLEAVKNEGGTASGDASAKPRANTVPIGISNRHVHLSGPIWIPCLAAGMS